MPRRHWLERDIVGALIGVALLSGCSQAAPASDAGAANVSAGAPSVDAAMATCSDLGGENAARIAACTAVIQASAAPPETRARALNNRGVLISSQGDLDRAIADYDAAIQIDPNYAAAFYNRAKAWPQKGDGAHADADSAEAVRLDPGLAGR